MRVKGFLAFLGIALLLLGAGQEALAARPAADRIIPSQGSSLPDEWAAFTTVFSDRDGWKDLKSVHLLIHSGISGRDSFFLFFDLTKNKLYLRNNAGTAWLGGLAPGSSRILENAQGRLDLSKTTVSKSGKTLTVKWRVAFKSSFAGKRNLYLKGQDGSTSTNWIPAGTWTIDGSAPSVPTVTDEGSYSASRNQLQASWESSDPESGIAEYQYAIGTSPGSSDVIGWTSIGTATGVTREDLLLERGKEYFFSVKAKNGAGAWSSAGSSDGITINQLPQGILEAADSIHISGWVMDPELASQPLDLEILIDGTVRATVLADRPRPDLVASGEISSPEHGFDLPTSELHLPPGSYSVSARVNDPMTGESVVLSGPTQLYIPDGPPALESITPLSGGSHPDAWVTFTTVYSDPNGWQDINEVQFIFYKDYPYWHAFILRYLPRSHELYLSNRSWWDSHESKAATPGTATILDSGLRLDASGTKVSGSGNTLTVDWKISFREGYHGLTYQTYLVAKDSGSFVFQDQARRGTWFLDGTVPWTPVVTDDGNKTSDFSRLHAVWSSSDSESGISEYQYAIGTSPGGANIAGWTSAGTSTEVTRADMTLTYGARYYFSVKARNGVGSWSAISSSDGITAGNQAPTLDPIGSQSLEETQTLFFTLTASDPDDDPLTFSASDLPTGASFNASTRAFTWTPTLTQSGDYSVTFQVSDGSLTDSETILLTVNNKKNQPPILKPIGDKLIRVQPSSMDLPPAGPSSAQSKVVSEEDGPQVLLIKVNPEAASRFESTVHAGRRLRSRASPAHLKRILKRSRRASERPLNLEELCCRYEVQQAKPLFAPPSEMAPKAAGLKAVSASGLGQILKMELISGREDLDLASMEFAQNPQVIYCEPRRKMKLFMTPNDPFLKSVGSWNQNYPDLWGLKRIQAEQAWDITAGSPDIVVAVVDTGIDPDHPDLFPNLWRNPGEIPGNGVDDDRNGFTDDTWGWDFTSSSPGDANPQDGHGHGTHVAGTIAAVGNNGYGIVGVAWGCRVMAVKGLDDSGSGYDDGLARAIVYASDNGARVINMSWGGDGRSLVLEDVMRYAHGKGVVLVAAAGNSNSDASNFTPANIEHVITVAAFDHTDHKASWSNWGSKIDVAAPGGDGWENDGFVWSGANILSCRAYGTDMYGDGLTLLGEYARARGTSMAAPHVAGLCALVLSRNPEYAPEQVRQILQSTADDILDPLDDGSNYAGPDPFSGAGRINAASAVKVSRLPDLRITSPRPNEALSGRQVTVVGSVGGSGFLSYKLEYGAGNSPQEWTEVAHSTQPVQEGILGTWNLEGLPFGIYTLRLSVFLEELPNPVEHRVTVYTQLPFRPGWPYRHPLRQTWGGLDLVVADLDGDGESETIGALGDGTLKVLDHRGRSKPLLSGMKFPGGSGDVRLAVGDLDGDQDLEIVGVCGSQILAWHHDGTLVKGWPVAGSYHGYYQDTPWPVLCDLDGDGSDEVLCLGSRYDGSTTLKHVEIYRGDGTSLPGWPKAFSRESVETGFWPLAADLDGDGDKEILLANRYASTAATLFAWHHDGSPVSGWPRFPSKRSYLSIRPVVADVDADGTDEILLPVREYDGSSFWGWGRERLYILNGKGEILRDWDTPWLFQLAVGDLDGDGSPEIIGEASTWVMASWPLLSVWHADGTPVPGWPVKLWELPFAKNKVISFGAIQLADVDGDDLPEILLGLFRGSGVPGAVGAYNPEEAMVAALHSDGTLVSGWPVRVAIPPPAGRSVTTSAYAPLWICLADLDRNGKRELIASWGIYGLAMRFGTVVQIEPTVLAAWDLPVSSATSAPWPMNGQNPRRSFSMPSVAVSGDHGTLTLQLSANDSDRDRLTYRVENLPAGAFFNPTFGFFRWKPSAEQAGTYSVIFSASDGTDSVSETVTITVRAGNQRPRLNLPAASYALNEAETLEFTLSGTDPDEDPLQFIGQGLPRGAVLDRKTGRFSWRPDFKQAGEYLLNFSAGDGNLEDQKGVAVVVHNVNRAPVLSELGPVVLREGQIWEFLMDAVDPDGEPIEFHAENLPPGATFLSETGFISWQPTFEQAGVYGPIVITATDGDLSDSKGFSITVDDAIPWSTVPVGPTWEWIRTPTKVNPLVLRGTKPAYTAVLVNGLEVIPRSRFTAWSTAIALTEGANPLEVRIRDTAGLLSLPLKKTVVLDTTPPQVTVTSPSPGQVIPLTGSGGSSS